MTSLRFVKIFSEVATEIHLKKKLKLLKNKNIRFSSNQQSDTR